jgi:hypothetical protein
VLIEAEQGDATATASSLRSCAIVKEPKLDSTHPEHRHTFLYLLHLLLKSVESW